MSVTKTDFHAIKELREQFTPAQRGVISAAEEGRIAAILELDKRDNIQLQNARDMSAMLYGQWAEAARQAGKTQQCMELMDAMSAVTGVIDKEKCRRGMPI